MPNIAQVLKQEIQRLARKEMKGPVGTLRKDGAGLKRTVADLKRRMAQLERHNRRLMAAEKKRQKEQAQVVPDEAESLRVTAKGIRSLRRKLKLSQANFAKLVGVSALSVYQWERKEGRLALRRTTKAALADIRTLGVREARKRVEEKAKQEKRASSRKSKRKSKKKARTRR